MRSENNVPRGTVLLVVAGVAGWIVLRLVSVLAGWTAGDGWSLALMGILAPLDAWCLVQTFFLLGRLASRRAEPKYLYLRVPPSA